MPIEPNENMPLTYDEEYNIMLQGFDVSLVPSDQGPDFFYVTLYEGGSEVYAEDIPMPEPQPGETSEETIENVAQAAIDIFEAERGTLGEGAGAEMTATKKRAWVDLDCYHEEWFLSFKGTEYEDLAYNLLKDYHSIDLEQSAQDDVLLELYDKEKEICFELKMLNLERLKAMSPVPQIVIIQAKKKAYFNDTEMMRCFLDKFCGDPLEGKVVNLMNELIDIQQQISDHEQGQESFYERRNEIERQMDALSLEALQKNVIEKIPTSGIEAFPNMAGEVAELMEGVELDVPLEPMMPNPFQAGRYAQMTPPEEPDDTYAQEWKPVEDRIKEKGEVHEGLDPAETLVDIPFKEGDKVKLKKKLEVSAPANGVKSTFESGATGYIDTEYDRNGDCYMVAFDDGGCVKVPADYLSAA